MPVILNSVIQVIFYLTRLYSAERLYRTPGPTTMYTIKLQVLQGIVYEGLLLCIY